MTSKWYQYSQNNSASGGKVPYAAKFYLGRPKTPNVSGGSL